MKRVSGAFSERTQTVPDTFWLARRWVGSLVPLLAGVALAAILQFALQPAIGPFRTNVLMNIGINIILAVSLNIVNGFTGQFSIGHAGFMAVGGYTAAAITYYTSFRLWGDAQVHGGVLSGMPGNGWITAGDGLFVGACLAGGVMAAIAGYLVGLPSLRLRGDYLAIVTLGFGEIVRVLLQQSDSDIPFLADEVQRMSILDMARHLGGSLGFSGVPFYSTLFWVWLFVSATLIVAFRLKRSSYGRAFLSIREDEIAAEAMGVPLTRFKVRAFVLAAFFAGIAGGLFAHEIGTALNPRELGFMKSFDIVIMVVLGGMGVNLWRCAGSDDLDHPARGSAQSAARVAAGAGGVCAGARVAAQGRGAGRADAGGRDGRPGGRAGVGALAGRQSGGLSHGALCPGPDPDDDHPAAGFARLE